MTLDPRRVPCPLCRGAGCPDCDRTGVVDCLSPSPRQLVLCCEPGCQAPFIRWQACEPAQAGTESHGFCEIHFDVRMRLIGGTGDAESKEVKDAR